MTTKTPEQIVQAVLDADAKELGHTENPDELWLISDFGLADYMRRAIEADRAQPEHDGTMHAAVIEEFRERENDRAAEYVEKNPNDFWDRFAAPMLDEIERYASGVCDYCDRSATGKNDLGENVCDEHAPVVIPEEDRCDVCEEEATNRWPNLAKPVKLCAGCYHDARRSGWEPGQ